MLVLHWKTSEVFMFRIEEFNVIPMFPATQYPLILSVVDLILNSMLIKIDAQFLFVFRLKKKMHNKYYIGKESFSLFRIFQVGKNDNIWPLVEISNLIKHLWLLLILKKNAWQALHWKRELQLISYPSSWEEWQYVTIGWDL